jgi:hypothetical protein
MPHCWLEIRLHPEGPSFLEKILYWHAIRCCTAYFTRSLPMLTSTFCSNVLLETLIYELIPISHNKASIQLLSSARNKVHNAEFRRLHFPKLSLPQTHLHQKNQPGNLQNRTKNVLFCPRLNVVSLSRYTIQALKRGLHTAQIILLRQNSIQRQKDPRELFCRHANRLHFFPQT